MFTTITSAPPPSFQRLPSSAVPQEVFESASRTWYRRHSINLRQDTWVVKRASRRF
uniref:Uncharacterized protein n=1 Tax=Hyaloperonospora arabidopsidis (strain Emoy2) TaxID=559515 RepID=M4B5W8_HYAAE